MTLEEKQQIKTKLEAEIISTKKSIVSYEDMTQPIKPENSLGRISRMDAINNKGVAEVALRQARLKLKNLIVMLNNIDELSFGLCAKCKNPIPIPRLMFLPESRHCVSCAR